MSLTDPEITIVQAILRTHTLSQFRDAIEAIGMAIGRDTTPYEIRSSFLEKKLGPPSSFCLPDDDEVVVQPAHNIVPGQVWATPSGNEIEIARIEGDLVFVRREGKSYISPKPLKVRRIPIHYALVQEAPDLAKRDALIARIVAHFRSLDAAGADLVEGYEGLASTHRGDTWIEGQWTLPDTEEDYVVIANLIAYISRDELSHTEIQFTDAAAKPEAFDVLQAVVNLARSLRGPQPLPEVESSSWDRLLQAEETMSL